LWLVDKAKVQIAGLRGAMSGNAKYRVSVARFRRQQIAPTTMHF